MADRKIAANMVMHEEDGSLKGKVIPATGVGRNGRERFGIVERFHPELVDSGFFDDMDHDEALELAEETLLHCYWDPILGDSIEDQNIADLLFSMAVNESCHEAVTLLQRAMGFLPAHVDGKMGPDTLGIVNSADPTVVLNALQNQANAFYEHVAQVNPDQQKNLQGWLNRIKNAANYTG